MKKLTVSRQVATKIKQGQSLLEKEDFESLPALDQPVQLLAGDGHSLGVGYLSEQNKGIGWFVSSEPLSFDLAFFQELFTRAKSYRSSYYSDASTTAFRLFNQEGDGLVVLRLTSMVSLLSFLGITLMYSRSKRPFYRAFKQSFLK